MIHSYMNANAREYILIMTHEIMYRTVETHMEVRTHTHIKLQACMFSATSEILTWKAMHMLSIIVCGTRMSNLL